MCSTQQGMLKSSMMDQYIAKYQNVLSEVIKIELIINEEIRSLPEIKRTCLYVTSMMLENSVIIFIL